MNGKQVRLGRIMDMNTGNALIVPMDHGFSHGPIDGIEDLRNSVSKVSEGGATAVVMHKGMISSSFRGLGRGTGLIMHLSASTGFLPGEGKSIVSSVEDAVVNGADAVSVHLDFGKEDESKMLESIGFVSSECDRYGMPLMIMAYPPSKSIKDAEVVAHCVRAATELGADIVKTVYTGDIESFETVCTGTPVPVLIAGGPTIVDDYDLLSMVYDSIEAGGNGVSIGRSIFGNRNVKKITEAIARIVFEEYDAREAYDSM